MHDRGIGDGIVVNVGSINGKIAFPVLSAYSTTKFAIEGLSESIAYELEPFGIKVISIEPGPIHSNFMKGSLSLMTAFLIALCALLLVKTRPNAR